MKKFILGLFLILGAMSIAAPEYVDVKGMEKKGYIIYKNKKDSFVAFKITQNDRIGVTLYFSELKLTILTFSIKSRHIKYS